MKKIVDEISGEQNNLSRILRQQTHIFNVEIQDIRKELHARNNEIHLMQPLLEKTMKNMHTQEIGINGLLYGNSIRQWAAHEEAKLDTLLQFVNIVINAREKKVHPALRELP